MNSEVFLGNIASVDGYESIDSDAQIDSLAILAGYLGGTVEELDIATWDEPEPTSTAETLATDTPSPTSTPKIYASLEEYKQDLAEQRKKWQHLSSAIDALSVCGGALHALIHPFEGLFHMPPVSVPGVPGLPGERDKTKQNEWGHPAAAHSTPARQHRTSSGASWFSLPASRPSSGSSSSSNPFAISDSIGLSELFAPKNSTQNFSEFVASLVIAA